MCLEVSLISRYDSHFIKNDFETLRQLNWVPIMFDWKNEVRKKEWSERENEWVSDIEIVT